MEYDIKTYYSKKDLPPIEDKNFFHYSSSFDWYNYSPTYKPFMLVAFKDDEPVASMFAVITRRNKFLRGKLFKRCFISQPPAFFDKSEPEIELFHALLTHLVNEVKNKVFIIRYENLGSSIFGYKGFRKNRFFSIKMVNVKNSLQKRRKIWDQLSNSRKKQVKKAISKGVVIEEMTSDEYLPEIYKLIEDTNHKKVTRRFPPYIYFENFFKEYIQKGRGKIILTRYNDKIVGGAILGFENSTTVYCLYYWGKSKRYKTINPTIFTLYSAMQMAEDEGFRFFDYMDVGYINKKTGRLYFLLQFGGKQTGTRRWYRYNWSLLNFFANKIYD